MLNNELHADMLCHYRRVRRHLVIELDQSFQIYHQLGLLTIFGRFQMLFYRHLFHARIRNQGVELINH